MRLLQAILFRKYLLSAWLITIFAFYNCVDFASAQNNAELAMRARINLYETWNFDSVVYYLDRIIDKKNTPAFAYSDFGWYLLLVDQHALGMQYIERAAKMDAPDQRQLTAWYAWALLWDGDLAKATQWIEQSLSIDPDYGEGVYVASLIASERGLHEEAIQLAEQAASFDSNYRSGIPLAFAKSGDKQKALQKINNIVIDENAFDAMILMEVYAVMENDSKALEYLEKAYQLRHPFLPWLELIPTTKHLHDHQRFKSIVQMINLPG